jgi:hypothetical protein
MTPEQLPAPEAAKRVRSKVEPISQTEIDELVDLYQRMKRSVHQTVKIMVKLGEKCCAIKTRLSHGQWGPWVRRNMPFTIRTATRAMQTYHRYKADPTLLDDPESFMAQIWGHEPKQLPGESDAGDKSDAASDNNNTDQEGCDSEDDEEGNSPRSRPAHIDPDEWTGMELVRNLGRTLDDYLKQPIAETIKLMMLVEAHNALCHRLDQQAEKLGTTLEQAAKGKRKS